MINQSVVPITRYQYLQTRESKVYTFCLCTAHLLGQRDFDVEDHLANERVAHSRHSSFDGSADLTLWTTFMNEHTREPQIGRAATLLSEGNLENRCT